MRFEDHLLTETRRDFFRKSIGGMGTLALAHVLAQEGRTADTAGANPLAPRQPHFAGKAKNVIFLFQEGGPSQLDLYDPKPGLQKWHGKPLPPSMTKDLTLAFVKPDAKILASERKFIAGGKSGVEYSDYLPHIGSCADDICLIRSTFTEAFNHHPGQSLLFTGSTQFGRPTAGAWVTYGLGSESDSLPGFVVLSSGRGTSGGSMNWTSGFLPSTYQGVVFRSGGSPILYLSNPPGFSRETQRARLDLIRQLNQERAEISGDRAISSRIHSYELAFRMQMSAPGLLDFSKESPATLEMYGVNNEVTRPYAVNCLLARRMVEAGVRFVMLAHASWDDHQELNKKLKKNCAMTDQPAAALIKDLKQRGLLDSTLVVWAGEFGRTPMGQLERTDEDPGRDHHPNCYSTWVAGGGVRGGQVIGRSDDIGLQVAEGKVHVHDLQATLLHCLGLDHTRLTYRHMGRDFRLTDVGGSVVKKMIG
ncbi:MAG TPA: DUF1501 domain-containing protein [Bryobacteraceae bacterium]|nr:DUF1501 domain-containing protein [Bryobacteraceae bacterium]